MFIGLALEIDSAIEHLCVAVHSLDKRLETFFPDKNYGLDVENIFVGVILTGPGSERLHPIRKLKYQKVLRIKIPGKVLEKKNVLQYDIKPDYEIFSRLNVEQARQHVAKALINSVGLLERDKAKFPDFDLLHFKEDLRNCLEK